MKLIRNLVIVLVLGFVAVAVFFSVKEVQPLRKEVVESFKYENTAE